MSEAEARNIKQPDPWETLRELRDVYMDLWSKSMIEAVKTEGYATMSGAMLDSALAFSAPYRETFEKTVSQTLQQLGLPTNADFAGLAGRLTNIEMRLDDMDAKLDRIEKLMVQLERFDSIETKLDSLENPTTKLEQVDDLNARLDRIEKLLVRTEPVQHKEQVEQPTRPPIQTALKATEVPKQSTPTKPPVKTLPAKEPTSKASNAMQQASAVKNSQEGYRKRS